VGVAVESGLLFPVKGNPSFGNGSVLIEGEALNDGTGSNDTPEGGGDENGEGLGISELKRFEEDEGDWEITEYRIPAAAIPVCAGARL
jgi:hypothetical protein